MSTLTVRPSIFTPSRKLCWVVVGLLILTLAASPGQFKPLPGIPPDVSGFGVLPLWFVPNAGQTDPVVRFEAHSANGTLFFSPDQITFSLASGGQSGAVVRLRFEGANPAPEMAGADPLTGSVNYFVGSDPARWRTDLPAYAGIVYRDVYPGIDLHYAGTQALTGRSFRLKGTYTVAPGADPARIRWRYQGASGVRLDEVTGDLRISLPGPAGAAPPSEIVERAPVAWQMIGGRYVPVNARYTLAADGSLGFALGDYDPAYALTLDPALTYSTYLGGNGHDVGNGIAVDVDGNVYVTGSTSSTDFPIVDAVQPTPHFSDVYTSGDAFVVKLAPDGSTLVYATYLGGSGGDVGWGIAVDGTGNAYVAGDTLSLGSFPVVNAPQPAYGVPSQGFDGDAFVVKLAPGGNALAYATYLGGSGDELAYDIAVDKDGRATVAGVTTSLDFPTVNAPQPTPAYRLNEDPGNAFVTQIISASGVYTWGYSTYLGGTNSAGRQDVAQGIALDADGNAYVTGRTGSPDFPLANPVQASLHGYIDAFVTKIISASGVYTWGYSTYLGGSDSDYGYDIAVDNTGAAYVVGQTGSADFPTKNALQGTSAGDDDVFVTKIINASGVYTWGYSTYLGGNGRDTGHGITLDGDYNATLTGDTLSTNFPVTANAFDRSCGSDGACNITHTFGITTSYADAFLVRLNATGAALSYATYLGGSLDDWGRAIALDRDGNAYMTGYTNASDFPTTAGAFDTSCGANGTCDGEYGIPSPDAFVAKIAFGPGPTPSAGPVYMPLVLKLPSTPPSPDCAPYQVASISVGDTPRGVAVAPGRVYVANYGSDSVSVIDSAGNAVLQTLSGISGANGVAYDPTRNRVWVTNYTAGQVTPIDGASLTALPPVPVGYGPWGVAYDPVHDFVYVVNHLGNSVTVVNAGTRAVVATLTGTNAFSQPFHIAANPTTGKIYVTNFGNDSVSVIHDSDITTIDLADGGDPSTQPYGIAVDETRDLVYVATVDSHRVVVIDGATDQVNWAAFHRGSNPARPVPLRAIAVNPGIAADVGGHLWATTSTADGSEANQALLIPKGWSAGFAVPVPAAVGANPAEGIAVDRASGYVYVTGGGAVGTVTVLADGTQMCPIAFGTGDRIGLEVGGK